MTSSRIRMGWRTTALILVNVLLVTAVALRLWKGTETQQILNVTAQHVTVPALRLDLPPLYADFTGLASRTPFYSTRRLHTQPNRLEAPPPPVPKYVFGGVVIRRHGPAVALLNNPTNGAALRVIAGNELDGWHVRAVEASRVLLSYEDQQAEITATKRASQSAAADGITRVPMTRSDRAPRSSGVRVLGQGQVVSRATPAASNLPPLAGSGSGTIYIPPPPR